MIYVMRNNWCKFRTTAKGASHERALVTVATMVGTLLLARAVDESRYRTACALPH